MASSDVSISWSRRQLADPRRHERHRRAQVAVQQVAVGLGQGDRVVQAVGHRGQEVGPGRATGVALLDASRSPAGRRGTPAAVGRCRGRRGRTAQSAPGQSSSAARRSRQAATVRATPRLRPRRVRTSFSFSHASSGSPGPVGRWRSSSHSSSGPRQPASLLERARRPIAQLEEIGDVGGGVRALARREGPAQPVREAIGLGHLHAELAGEEVAERRRGMAEEAGRQLRVEQPGRDGADGPVSTSRSCWAAWNTASPGPSKSRRNAMHVDSQGSTRAMPPGQPSCTKASFGW